MSPALSDSLAALPPLLQAHLLLSGAAIAVGTVVGLALAIVSARSAAVRRPALALAGLGALVLAGPAWAQNERAARILGMFDIDGRGGADQSPDSDGDGLPDSWEFGGLDPANTDVPFPAPQAIVPGTPPDPIFARRPVRTRATSRDSDGDGLTDFIEVFGLKFIDDNNNGILDDATVRVATSAHVASAVYALLALARLRRPRLIP